MKIMKYELVRAIDRAKGVIVRNAVFPALEGVLIKDGYLTASNQELTVQVKLQDLTGTPFILPFKSFDLIKTLPEGEVELIPSEDGNSIQIKAGRIKNTYPTYPADNFSLYRGDVVDQGGVTLPGVRIMEGFNHILFAADEKSNNAMMSGILLEQKQGVLNLVALDGHVVAWDRIEAAGAEEFSIVVPKTAIRKIVSMGMLDDISVSCTENSATFRAKDYVIYSRLLAGNYFNYRQLFGKSDTEMFTIIEKKTIVDAMTRAEKCVDDLTPTVFDIKGDELTLTAVSSAANYSEVVTLQTPIQKDIRVGFSSKLVLETVRAFTCEEITMNFTSPSHPMVIEASDSEMKALVLPVKIRE